MDWFIIYLKVEIQPYMWEYNIFGYVFSLGIQLFLSWYIYARPLNLTRLEIIYKYLYLLGKYMRLSLYEEGKYKRCINKYILICINPCMQLLLDAVFSVISLKRYTYMKYQWTPGFVFLCFCIFFLFFLSANHSMVLNILFH